MQKVSFRSSRACGNNMSISLDKATPDRDAKAKSLFPRPPDLGIQ